MTKLQNPDIPVPQRAIEIEKAVYEMQMLFETNLNWLSHGYARVYRHLDAKSKRLYFPEVYIGGSEHKYFRPTPDNDSTGMCFFVVNKEENRGYEAFSHNYLTWRVGIIFQANMKLIDEALIQTENFTQNLISDVRGLLTRGSRGLSFTPKIINVEQEFREIYREFTLEEKEGYLRSPQTGFRINLDVTLQEDCDNQFYDRGEALSSNISPIETAQYLLDKIDFSVQGNFDALTAQQRIDLIDKLTP